MSSFGLTGAMFANTGTIEGDPRPTVRFGTGTWDEEIAVILPPVHYLKPRVGLLSNNAQVEVLPFMNFARSMLMQGCSGRRTGVSIGVSEDQFCSRFESRQATDA